MNKDFAAHQDNKLARLRNGILSCYCSRVQNERESAEDYRNTETSRRTNLESYSIRIDTAK